MQVQLSHRYYQVLQRTENTNLHRNIQYPKVPRRIKYIFELFSFAWCSPWAKPPNVPLHLPPTLARVPPKTRARAALERARTRADREASPKRSGGEGGQVQAAVGLSFEMDHSLSFPMRVFTDQFLAGSLRFRSWSSAASLSRIFSSTERLVNHSLAFSSSS